MSAPIPIAFFVQSPPMEGVTENVQELMNSIANSLGTNFASPTPGVILGQLGGVLPTQNVGPWANGPEWWFYDSSQGGYVRGEDGVPVGMIMIWGGSAIPQNWLLCDGSEILRDTYNTLFQVVGTSWGAGDGVSTFNLPPGGKIYLNQKGFVPAASVPIDAGYIGTFVGGRGGSQVAPQLKPSNLPPLKVRAPFTTASKKTQGGLHGFVEIFPASQTGLQTLVFYLEDVNGGQLYQFGAGNGTQFSTMPPFIAANHIIKAQ